MSEKRFIRGEHPTPRVTLTCGNSTHYQCCLYIDGALHKRFIDLDEAIEAFEQAVKDYSYE